MKPQVQLVNEASPRTGANELANANPQTLTFQTIETLSKALAVGEVTSEALTLSYLDRIQRFDHQLHAFADVYPEQAVIAARKCDAERRAGLAKGPLHGVPIAIKDIFDYAGHPTQAGSNVLTGRIPTQSATCIRRLEAAGMIVLGKTHMVEFAFGGWGTNPVKGTPWNPWDLNVHRVPGGSSSGSAVAVASGLAPAALGTDTGGSVRTPAAWCGTVGLKTSHGLVSREGVVPLCPTHDTVGFLTRSVYDAALLLDLLAAYDPEDPSTAAAPQISALECLDQGVAGLRIAVLQGDDVRSVDPEIMSLFNDAVGNIEALGARLEPLQLPHSVEDYVEQGGDIMSAESYAHLGSYVEAEDAATDPVIRDRILRGRNIPASRYIRLLQARWSAQIELRSALEGIDAFLVPSVPQAAIPIDQVDENHAPNIFGRFVNFLDLSSLSVPIGLTGLGLPAGMQIVARRFQDPMALRIGWALEQDRGGLVRRPPGL